MLCLIFLSVTILTWYETNQHFEKKLPIDSTLFFASYIFPILTFIFLVLTFHDF